MSILEVPTYPLVTPETFLWGLTYYTAGPVAGFADHRRVFDTQNAYLRRKGVRTRSPMEVNMPADVTWERALQLDLAMVLTDCGGIIMLDHWTHSRGANLELFLCQKLGYPAYKLSHYVDHAELTSVPAMEVEEYLL